MTQEERQLLLKDLCARLPYGVIVDNPNPAGGSWDEVINIDTSAKTVTLLYNGRVFSIDYVKPYLRPMSSMTEEEYKRCKEDTGFSFGVGVNKESFNVYDYIVIDECGCVEIYTKEIIEFITWLYKNQFDVSHLIEKGLALEAPDGMYN